MKQFKAGSCYSYIIESQGEALIIDPHISLRKEYADYIKKRSLRLKYIVDTHTHADHFSLAAVLKKEFACEILMHERAVSKISGPRVKDGDVIEVGSIRLKVIYTPGHTDDAISLYGENKVFTGDVLLIGSVGRTDFQNGSAESMFDTLQKLKSLPEETVVFPGHDYNNKRSSAIGREKKTNPYMKETDRIKFIDNMKSKVIPKPFNIENIIRVNRSGEAESLEMVLPGRAYDLAGKDPSVKFLDVRSATEFNEAHIKDSINIPIDALAAKTGELGRAGEKYIVLCRTGNRSAMAADMLMQSGIASVKVMDGGLLQWQKDKLPVIKGPGVISLERQVRIVAGSFILCGILLSWFVSWQFIFIAVFVSCGLIYAGITDNCMMGMLLMKLPYNSKLYKSKYGGGTCSM